jgi:hypothetical protein
MNSQTGPKKKRPKDLERLYLSPIRKSGILAVVEGARSYTKEEILMRASVFLNTVADVVRCEGCGCVYDGTNYFMVEYTGFLEKLRRVRCGKCDPEIKRLINDIYKDIVISRKKDNVRRWYDG